MPIQGKKSLTLYEDTVETLGKEKGYGETWDDYLLDLLHKSGRAKGFNQEASKKGQQGDNSV